MPDAAIEAVLAELGLLDWVRTLPAGLDTPLAAGRQGFSAGEAQLVAFTRLLLRDPGLVILDEAASRFDPITERWLEAAIARLLHHRTAVIVAHRLQTVQRADDILKAYFYDRLLDKLYLYDAAVSAPEADVRSEKRVGVRCVFIDYAQSTVNHFLPARQFVLWATHLDLLRMEGFHPLRQYVESALWLRSRVRVRRRRAGCARR